MQNYMFGTSKDDLFAAHMQYILKHDPETIPAAFTGVSSVYQPDFNDIFTKHELERVPWQTNMGRFLREIAQKEFKSSTACNVRYRLMDSILDRNAFANEKKMQFLYKDDTDSKTWNKSFKIFQKY